MGILSHVTERQTTKIDGSRVSPDLNTDYKSRLAGCWTPHCEGVRFSIAHYCLQETAKWSSSTSDIQMFFTDLFSLHMAYWIFMNFMNFMRSEKLNFSVDAPLPPARSRKSWICPCSIAFAYLKWLAGNTMGINKISHTVSLMFVKVSLQSCEICEILWSLH